MAKNVPTFYTQYNRPESFDSNTFGDSDTVQYFKDETDINSIIAKYGIETVIESAKSDVSILDVQDYTDFNYDLEMQRIADVKSQFYELPSSERIKFNHSPGEWLSSKIADLQSTVDAQVQHDLDALYPKQEKSSDLQENPPNL